MFHDSFDTYGGHFSFGWAPTLEISAEPEKTETTLIGSRKGSSMKGKAILATIAITVFAAVSALFVALPSQHATQAQDMGWGNVPVVCGITNNGDGSITFQFNDGSSCTYFIPPAGPQGPAGVGITSIVDNGDGTFTVVLSDSTSYTMTMPEGPQGVQGVQGPQGEQGIQGVQGDKGDTGVGIASIVQDNETVTFNLTDGSSYTVSLPVGPQGIQGVPGELGATGPEGAVGPQGPQGLQGIQGLPGTNGVDGLNGANGVNGVTGAEGDNANIPWWLYLVAAAPYGAVPAAYYVGNRKKQEQEV